MGVPNPPIFNDENPPQPGDALRLNSAGDAWEPFTPSGASYTASALTMMVLKVNVPYNAANLENPASGVALFTPLVGDLLWDIVPEIVSAFTAAVAIGEVDVLCGGVGITGYNGGITGVQDWILTNADRDTSAFVAGTPDNADILQVGGQGNSGCRTYPVRFKTATALKLRIADGVDGTGGPGFTAGEMNVYCQIATSNPAHYL